ncbi:MAG: hypothetical protein FWC39_06465 [Bacteroidetes bacterium]|nr:hypothetical protein [Bacteroidota bacterium]MCL2328143.1 hypothetical protein [Bacteroidota bacterium]
MAKPRIIKDFEKLDTEIQEQIKLSYPTGFFEHLVSYTDRDGNGQWALPFETEEKYYLVRMSIAEAKKLISDDDDYDDNGVLRDDIQEMYQEKYSDDIDDFDADFGSMEVAAKDIELDIKNELGVEEDEEEEDENKKSIENFDDDDDDYDEYEIGEEDFDEDEDEEE